MATYKITSKKTGKFREGLSLDEALALTKMSATDFTKAISRGHPKISIEMTTSGGDRVILALAGVVSLLAVAIVTAGLNGMFKGEEMTAANCWGHNETSAYIYSQSDVKNLLKSPGTAKFPFADYKFRKDGNCVFVVQSYVDSQNGFGATVRTNYTARVKFTGKNEWTADITHVAQR